MFGNLKNTCRRLEMKDLVYYTVGFSASYIDVLHLSINSLRKSGYIGDIAVLCDASFLNRCRQHPDSGIQYLSLPDSNTPEQASMNKLRIFELPTIESYDRVLFLDSDIIVHMDIYSIMSGVNRDGILYVYTENQTQESHRHIFWSLLSYTDTELETFRNNSIHVFNAGCFAFVRSNGMKQHFLAVQYMVMNHTGSFFYEQSFMNVYFNRNGQTDRSLLTEHNYTFPPRSKESYRDHLVHFAGDPGNGAAKCQRMQEYTRSHLTN